MAIRDELVLNAVVLLESRRVLCWTWAPKSTDVKLVAPVHEEGEPTERTTAWTRRGLGNGRDWLQKLKDISGGLRNELVIFESCETLSTKSRGRYLDTMSLLKRLKDCVCKQDGLKTRSLPAKPNVSLLHTSPNWFPILYLSFQGAACHIQQSGGAD